MDKPLFDEDFTEYETLGTLYTTLDDFKEVLDSDGTLYNAEFLTFVASSLYSNYLFDKIAYLDKYNFEYRIYHRMIEVAPLLYKKFQYYELLVDQSTSKEDFVSTGGMTSVRETDIVVSGDSFQKTANTPTKITPTDTTDFTSAYTNFQGKVNTQNTSGEDSSTTINRFGGTEELFTLLNKLPQSLYTEVCMLFAQHFLTIYN